MRVLLAGLLLFAQILGATLAGAAAGTGSPIELCTAGGVGVAADPDDPSSDRSDHELCDFCLAGCCRAPPPGLARLEGRLANPVAAAPARPAPATPAPTAPRALRPPGRAPPALS